MIYLCTQRKEFWTSDFYEYIDLEEAIELLRSLPEISNDTETTGLSCHTKQLLLVQLGNDETQILFDIESYQFKIPQILKEFMNSYNGTWILQNAKFDLQFYYKQGIILKKVYDTMLVETIITLGLQEERDGKLKDVRRDLKTICKKYCNYDMDKSVRGEIITQGLTDRVLKYASDDIKYLPLIKKKQQYYIKGLNLQNAVTLDNAFVRVLAYIEYCGIKLDWEKWKSKALQDLEQVAICKKDLDMYLYNNGFTRFFLQYDLFSDIPECTLNWNSPKQIIPVFEELGINCTTVEKGEKKKSIDEKTLSDQIPKFEILQLYFKYKNVVKQSSTYGLNWESMINESTKRIHTVYRQIMNTGRLSSGDADRNAPNMQNLPHDAYTRSCFVSELNNSYSAIDYVGQESIVLANFSNDTSLINFYNKGLTDMHSYVAFLLYPELQQELNKTAEELTNDDLKYIKKHHPDLRNIAKTAEFAIAYGGNGSTIAKNTGCSKKQGEAVYNQYFESFSGMKDYFSRMLNKTLANGYIEYNTITNRKFLLDPKNPIMQCKEIGAIPPELERDYESAVAEIQRLSQNYPIQGSSADISKLAGVFFFKEILDRGWFDKVKIVNMVHDEYNIEAPDDLIEEATTLIVNSMKQAGSIFCKIIPLDADAQIGKHWIH